MRTSFSLPRFLILTLIIALVISTALRLQAKADGTPPVLPIEIVEPGSTNPDSTTILDSLAGPDSFNQDDLSLLNWLMILLTVTF